MTVIEIQAAALKAKAATEGLTLGTRPSQLVPVEPGMREAAEHPLQTLPI